MNVIEELSVDGVRPSGPCSAWPRERHERLMAEMQSRGPSVKASIGKMATGLMKTAGQAILHGKVSAEIREERYNTCKACPFFVKDSKRCSDCGCFMEAKTWVGGNPDMLCPQKKWER